MRLNHSFSVELAEKYGVECAILIQHFQFWIEQNQSMRRNFHEGRTWMYQTQKEIASVYPYLSEDSVARTIKKLIDEEILIKGNFNKTSFDRTIWYAFKNEEMFTKPRNRGMEEAKPRNPKREIADTIPYTKPDTIQEQQHSAAAFLKIYQCLESLDMPNRDKIEITERNLEEKVKKAIAWATHPETKINKTLAQAIKWACLNEPEAPKNKGAEVELNKAYAKQQEAQYPNGITISCLNKCVEIACTQSQRQPTVIEYTEQGFKEQLDSALRKSNITPR